LKNWDEKVFRALSHPTRRRIIECLRESKIISFQELSQCVGIANHGKLGFHIRALTELVERDPSIRKYRLTDRGQLAAELILDIRFIISRGGRDLAYEPTRYVRRLSFGDHAFLLYDTEDVKHEISFSFLESGLPKGEAVIYLVPEHKLDSESREIQRYGITADYFRNEAFTMMSAEEWYLKKGKAHAKKIIDNWKELAKEKQKAGFTGVRVAGDVEVFFNNAKVEELFRYEAALGRQLPPNLCALCVYDAKKLDEKQVYQLTNYHGHLICKDMAWKITSR